MAIGKPSGFLDIATGELMKNQKNQNVFNATLEDFEALVLQKSAEKPVLVDMWADWCSPCVVVGPILEKVVEEYEGQILLAKIEVDDGENMKLAGRYHVRGFPTVILFEDGQEKARFSGAKPKHFIEQFVEDNSDKL